MFDPKDPATELAGIGPEDEELLVPKVTLISDYVEEHFATRHLKAPRFAVSNKEKQGTTNGTDQGATD